MTCGNTTGLTGPWVSGSNTAYASGSYGDQGIPAPDNVPGAREGAVSWTDASGVLWLFGGYRYDGASGNYRYLNDLWKYDGTHWAWVSGSNTTSASGIYGTQGTAASDNVPGARSNAVSWTDASGGLWLFGGEGRDANGSYSLLNDLWKYDGTNWTWVSGSNTAYASGSYGDQGIPAPDNVPGAREGAVSWTDDSGVLWLLGGYGLLDAAYEFGYLNDLWKYDGTHWTWVSGSNTAYASGIYGDLGTAAPDNVPGARYDAVSWTDASGGLWLLGGYGLLDAAYEFGYLNDLWKLQIGNRPLFTSSATSLVPENTTITETVLDVDAHNGDGGSTDEGITYTLSGNDAGKFRISSTTGVITFHTSPDFENPADKGGDNVYNIIVQANDEGALTATQSLTITVTNDNDNAPVFTSAVTASVSENTTAVVTLATTDADGQSKITYRLSGGADKALFTILDDKLLFIKAPDFEKPADANGDNHFILTVAAGDGKHETEISIDVEVINDKGDDHLLSTSADLRLSVYPNPATDVLTVEGTLKEGELQLVNLMGVTVLRQQFTGRARLELAHLPDGLYLLRLHSGNSYSTYKVMKK